MHADWLILSSIIVWINKILIYVKSTFSCKTVLFLTNEILTFSGTVESNKKWEKLLTMFASLNKIHASLFMASLQRLFASIIPGIWPYGVLLLKKRTNWCQFFLSVLILMIKLHHDIVKVCLWFCSHFDNVMMQFIIKKKTDASKTDVNLLNLHCSAAEINIDSFSFF